MPPRRARPPVDAHQPPRHDGPDAAAEQDGDVPVDDGDRPAGTPSDRRVDGHDLDIHANPDAASPGAVGRAAVDDGPPRGDAPGRGARARGGDQPRHGGAGPIRDGGRPTRDGGPIHGGDGPPGDAALLGAYALGALTPEERAAVEARLAGSPILQAELRRLIPVAALLKEGSDSPRTTASSPTSDPPLRLEDPSRPRASRPLPRADADPEQPDLALPDLRPDPSPHHPERSEESSSSQPAAAPPTPQGATALLEVAAPDATSSDDQPPAGDHPAAHERRDEQDIGVLRSSDEHGAATGSAMTARVEAAPGSLSSRSSGRGRVREAPAAARSPRRARTSPTLGPWPPSWVAAGLATLVAVGAILWALALVDRLDARQGEVDTLRTELAALRARGDAAVIPLAPAEGGPAGAEGVVVLVPTEGTLIVRAGGLPPSAEGRVYQLWFRDAADDPWRVGPVFRVGGDGAALAELAVVAPAFTRLALSDEPNPGSAEPSGAFLLEGAIPTPPDA